MTAAHADDWKPLPEHVSNANVTALANRLGVRDYDALYRFSIERPDEYWRAVSDFCDIAWARPYTEYVDFSRGKEFPNWFIDGELNWTETVLAWADRPGSAARLAVIAESEDGSTVRLTYSELKSRVRRLAAGLRDLGIRRGDRVGLLMEMGVEATISLLGLSYIGAIVVPLFSGFGTDAIISRLSSCGARAIIGTTGFHRRGRFVNTAAVLTEARRQLPAIEFLILKPIPGQTCSDPNTIEWQTLETTATPDFVPERMGANDPFMVIFTSGTTGRPKGAVHTHGGFPLKIAHDSAVHFDVKPDDVFCWPADMGWIAGALVMSSALLRGATLVCYDGAPDYPDWSRMSRLVERHGITHFGSAPTLIRGLAANAVLATAGDLSSIRLLITAGEVIAPEHFAWYQRAFGKDACPVINYTGGTEVSGALLSNVMVKPIFPGGFNSASPGVAVDVVDAKGCPIVDAIGELAVLAPFVGMTQSFWHDDERYVETYWRAVPGLWIHGDLAIRSREQGFVLRGRSDDTIKVAGKRLGPAEVEEVVLELPDISEAAAIGVDDPVKGQKVVLFVVPGPRHDATVDLSGLASRHLETRLGKPFRPSEVHNVRQLPKTKSGKVMRRVIRSIYCGVSPGDLSSLDDPSALDEIRRLAPGEAGQASGTLRL
jgi:acetyl-CoA synthetase